MIVRSRSMRHYCQKMARLSRCDCGVWGGTTTSHTEDCGRVRGMRTLQEMIEDDEIRETQSFGHRWRTPWFSHHRKDLGIWRVCPTTGRWQLLNVV